MRRLCDRVAVMYAGRIVELAPAADLFSRPLHPYAQALLAATPSLDPDTRMPPPLPGEPPRTGPSTGGCVFAARCPHVRPACRVEEQVLMEVEPDRSVACGRWGELVGYEVIAQQVKARGLCPWTPSKAEPLKSRYFLLITSRICGSDWKSLIAASAEKYWFPKAPGLWRVQGRALAFLFQHPPPRYTRRRINVPLACASPDHPGATRVVVSSCVTIAGPTKRSPAPSASRSYSAVSAVPAPQCTTVCPATRAPAPGGNTGRTGGGSRPRARRAP